MKKFSLLFAFLAVAAFCRAATFQVHVANNSFVPNQLSITEGDMVTWIFEENGHTTTSGTGCAADGKWDSGTIPSGNTYSHTFSTAGEYPYFCKNHCSMMQAIITVRAASGMREPLLPGKNSFTNSPNPFLGNTSFSIYSVNASKGTIEVFTLEGKTVAAVNISVAAGSNVIPVSLDLPAGSYIARLNLDGALPQDRILVRRR